MSELRDVLGTHGEAICRALAEKLKRAACPTLAQARAGDCGAVFEAFCACCRDPGDAPEQAWAGALYREGVAVGLPCAEVMSALHCLERAVRFQIVKSISQKTALLSALSEMSAALERLRRAYVEAACVEGSGEQGGVEDFVALAQCAGSFICLASLHGKPFYLNRAARRLLGLADDEPLRAATLHEYYTDESWAELRDVAVPAVNESGRWQGRSQLRHVHTGDLIEMLTSVFLVRRAQHEKPSCLAIMHDDPSEQDLVAEALVEAEARKHAILESALDPIITINHEGVITEFNRAAEQVFGHARDKVLGTKPSDILFPPSKSAGHQDRIDRYLDVGEGSMLGKRIEVTAIRASGETFPAEMAMTISQEHGAPVLTFFVRDISLRKKAEQGQARYAAELERSNRELEQFAYVASHDLQEPLRKIQTFSDRLRMKCQEQLDEVGRECVDRMQSAAERMQVLIDGLLRLSRVTTKGQDFVPVDLAKVAREVVSDLEVQIESAGGRVEVDKLPSIQADPLQMRQLLQNLIGNALKFRRIEEPPVVKVSARYVPGQQPRQPGRPGADEQCRILVEDNGIGFAEKHRERIFGVFQRLHPRDVYGGTGIGLAICRRIVERHGGTITAHSTPGRGSAFEVLLPVVQAKKRKA